MRLTLRNMLAYMEDILEPADAQDIAKKIEESEFATSLMHRIRDVTRRLRLAAPKLEGRGIGLDPNTVAEYLDNTLPSERVPDFEKVCLESDVHLAEVASAHQILALVLGEPADIDPAVRRKMYQLIDGPRAPSSDTLSAIPAAVTPPPMDMPNVNVKGDRKKLEVPDYLREGSPRRSKAGLIAALLAFVLIGGGIAAVVKFNLLGLNRGEEKVAQGPPGAVAPAAVPPGAVPPAVAPATVPAVKPPETAAAPAGAVGQPTTLPVGTAPAGAPPAGMPPAGSPGAGTATNTIAPGTDSPPPLVNVPLTGPFAPQTPGAAAPGSTGNPVSPLPAAPGPAPAPLIQPTETPRNVASTTVNVPAQPGKMPVESPVAPLPPNTPLPSAAAKPGPAELANSEPPKLTAPPVVPDAAEGIGRLISEGEVLLRYDRASQTWRRVATRGTVFAGDRLISLPSYRSNLTLTTGVNVQLFGGTAIELIGADAGGLPGVRLLEGRLIMLTLGRPKAKLRVQAGEVPGVVEFVDGDSTLAIEVRRQHEEGANPEKETAPSIVDLYATAGNISWSDRADGPPQSLKAPSHHSLGPAPETPAPADLTEDSFPAWIKVDERSPIELRASREVEQALQADRPISLTLKELAGDKRTEISTLAVQSLAQLGEFDAFVTSLSDSLYRAGWNAEIESLRAAIARSPGSAAQVREALERHRGPKGIELYRMLWGYSPDQLQGGAAAILVKNLDHEDLDFRVLSFWNLSHITGATHYYRPELTAAKRIQAVRAWKQKLDTGQIPPKTP